MFRVLKAEVLLQQDSPQQVLTLLAPEPLESLPAEFKIRRRLLQARALCSLGKQASGNTIFLETEPLIPKEASISAAELAFARGACILPTNRAEALRYYLQAAELSTGSDTFIQANGLLGVGYVLLVSENYDEAIDAFNQALALTDYPSIRERALGNLGYSYSQLGDYRRAIGYSRDAAKIAADLGRLDHEEKWLLDLGHENDAIPGLFPGEAEASYSKALSLAKELGDVEVVHRCLHNLTQGALENHDLLKAEDFWRQEAVSKTPESLFNEARIAVAKREFSKAASIFQALLADANISWVLRAATEQQLGTVYWAENKTFKADLMFRKSLETTERALAAVREDHRASSLDEYPFFDPYVRFLVAQGKTVQALEIAERGRTAAESADLMASRKLDIKTVETRLKKAQQIILVYQLTNEESFLWVITLSQFKIFHLPRHAELYSQIEAYNKEIQDHRDTSNSAAAQKLFTTLVQPAAGLIAKDSRVTIIPSKVLYGLNFETLVVPGASPHYWIDDVEIQTASSLTAISKPASVRQKPTKDLLQVGAPVEVSKEFPVLKYAGEEIDTITKRFSGRAQTIAGKNATPQAYLSSNPKDFRLIQFVTHGTASDTVPLESAIILSQQGDNSFKLYARDIVKKPLHADLVTISACYGAGTRWYQSEGLVGLAWAFLHAGAHQVVAGLWEVDDAATPQLMDHFYAKLKMLHSGTVYKHPFYWASLQLYTGR